MDATVSGDCGVAALDVTLAGGVGPRIGRVIFSHNPWAATIPGIDHDFLNG